MPILVTANEICIRLALTMMAGAMIGFNRGARGHAAGFRTTILVCLAASVAMIQANMLLPLSGKMPESFAVMDLMRLPLGVLTGVGFIGGGAILKKGDLVTGVTTAATLWLVTVIGLCMGGGQLSLGIAATGLGVITLWVLKWVDLAIPREHRATMVIMGADKWDTLSEIEAFAAKSKFKTHFRSKTASGSEGANYTFDVAWRRPELETAPLDFLNSLAQQYAIKSFELTSDNGR